MSAEVKPQHMRTAACTLPEGWNRTTIKSVIELVIDNRGKTPPLASYGLPLLEINSIYGGAKSPDPSKFEKFVSRDVYESWFRNGHPKKGDILIATVGAAGASAIINDTKACIAQNLIGLRPSNKVDADFLFYTTRSNVFKSQVDSVLMGGVQPSLKVPHLLSFSFAYPVCKEEQAAISLALSDMDALISGLDQLIAKKHDIKQAAMQQLLTGQQRLPGFSGEWEVKRLGSLLTFQVGYPFSSVYFTDGLNAIRLIKNRDLKNDGQPISFVGPYDESYIVNNGDLLIGMDGDFIPCLWSKGMALLNQRVGRIVPGKMVDPVFCYYAVKDPLKEIEISTGATTVKHLSHNDVADIKIGFPERKEQAAIATILSDMDIEITTLEARRDKARQLKQGMMQELLTGRIRLLQSTQEVE